MEFSKLNLKDARFWIFSVSLLLILNGMQFGLFSDRSYRYDPSLNYIVFPIDIFIIGGILFGWSTKITIDEKGVSRKNIFGLMTIQWSEIESIVLLKTRVYGIPVAEQIVVSKLQNLTDSTIFGKKTIVFSYKKSRYNFLHIIFESHKSTDILS